MDTEHVIYALRGALLAAVDESRSLVLSIDGLTEASDAESFAALDSRLRDAFERIRGIRRYALLHSPPVVGRYGPAALFGRYQAHLLRPGQPKDLELEGDTEQLIEAVEVIRDNVTLGAAGRFAAYLNLGEEPRLTLGQLGRGKFPAPLLVGEGLTVSMVHLDALWCAATQGGSIAGDSDELTMYLTGDGGDDAFGRPVYREIAATLASAVKGLVAWRGASGVYEGAYATGTESLLLYRKAIEGARSSVAAAVSIAGG